MANKNLFFVIGVLLLSFVGFWYFAQDTSVRRDNVIVVGTNAEFPPFEFVVNGQLVGFDIDLVQEIAKRLHKEVVFKDMAFSSLLLEAQMGTISLIAAALTPTVEREKQLLFTKPYLEQDALVVVTRNENIVKSIEDLFGKDVAVNQGFSAETYMAQYKNDLELHSFDTVIESLLALNSNRVFAYVGAKSSLNHFLAHAERVGLYNIFELADSDSYAFALSKSHANLLPMIEDALDSIVQDGTMSKLKQKWHL